MLLLVVDAQGHQGLDFGQFGLAGVFQEVDHAGINEAAVLVGLADRGPREQSAARSAMAFAHGVVIRVEQKVVLRKGRNVAFVPGLKQKGFEEPTGVGQMPFGGRGVRHGLDHVVLRLQGFAEQMRKLPGAKVQVHERGNRMQEGLGSESRHETPSE